MTLLMTSSRGTYHTRGVEAPATGQGTFTAVGDVLAFCRELHASLRLGAGIGEEFERYICQAAAAAGITIVYS